jgi:hypothetical protein
MDGNELVRKTMDFLLREGCTVNEQAVAEAVKRCIDEALGEPTAEEAQVALKEQAEFERAMTERHKYTFTHSVAMRIVANRKARLLAPKTAEERVTIEPCPRDSWKVLLDGKFHFGGNGVAKCDAEIYRDGLILKLKEQQS